MRVLGAFKHHPRTLARSVISVITTSPGRRTPQCRTQHRARSQSESDRGARALRTATRNPQRLSLATHFLVNLASYSTMPHKETERGAAAWLRRWWRALAGELAATALLVLLGVASTLPVGGAAAPLTHPALAFGLVVLVNVEVFGPVSGAHMNPAVTLAALLDGRLAPLPALAYAAAQLLGATLGFGALMGLAPAAFEREAGAAAPGPGVSAAAAAGVEALLVAPLALLCCAVWAAHDAHGPDRTVPIKFGLTVAGLVYAGGALSGASLNPARSLAPALLQQAFHPHHWAYWVGPLGGAALGALLHRALRPPRPATPAPPAEALPLHDKPDH